MLGPTAESWQWSVASTQGSLTAQTVLPNELLAAFNDTIAAKVDVEAPPDIIHCRC